MTDQTNAELIAEARTHVTDEYITPDTSAEESLIRRLASALEAAEKRATYPEAERDSAMASYKGYMALHRKAAELAARLREAGLSDEV